MDALRSFGGPRKPLLIKTLIENLPLNFFHIAKFSSNINFHLNVEGFLFLLRILVHAHPVILCQSSARSFKWAVRGVPHTHNL